MKKIFSGLMAFAAITLFLASCTKTNTIDNTMQAYSDNFTVKSSDWVADGNGLLTGLEMNDMIDNNTLRADGVHVYISLDKGKNYEALNTTLYDNVSKKDVAYSYTHGVDNSGVYNVTLYAANTDKTKTATPPDLTVKVVVVPAKLIGEKNVNMKDYSAGKAAFKLAD